MAHPHYGADSFDKYGASQIVQLVGVNDKDNQFAGLTVNDQDRRMKRRLWIGRGADGAVALSLMDAEGRKRIVMQVTADGTASLDFLDAEGHVVRSFVPANPAVD
jgi:hypothetical protein